MTPQDILNSEGIQLFFAGVVTVGFLYFLETLSKVVKHLRKK